MAVARGLSLTTADVQRLKAEGCEVCFGREKTWLLASHPALLHEGRLYLEERGILCGEVEEDYGPSFQTEVCH